MCRGRCRSEYMPELHQPPTASENGRAYGIWLIASGGRERADRVWPIAYGADKQVRLVPAISHQRSAISYFFMPSAISP